MITLEEYWMGRDKTYESEMTTEIRQNAEETVSRTNQLLAMYYEATDDRRRRRVNSGWRPTQLNARIKNAAKLSRHTLGMAVDIADASKALKRWLMTEEGQNALIECCLWMEHPHATPTWVHLQTEPPGSGNRVFYP